MSLSATERYDIALAPNGLALVQDLLNTRPAGRPRKPDLLGDLASAQSWLEHAVELWSTHAGRPGPALTLSEQELPRLRALRDHLRQALWLRRHGGEQPGYELGPEHPLVFAADLRLTLGRDGTLTVDPSGGGASWVVAAVLGEIQHAQILGTWRRLKVCGNDKCLGAFYDRSRNNSGVWHDVHVCGNAANLRASRARRRASRSDATRALTTGE
jgi:hypothetical protein